MVTMIHFFSFSFFPLLYSPVNIISKFNLRIIVRIIIVKFANNFVIKVISFFFFFSIVSYPLRFHSSHQGITYFAGSSFQNIYRIIERKSVTSLALSVTTRINSISIEGVSRGNGNALNFICTRADLNRHPAD